MTTQEAFSGLISKKLWYKPTISRARACDIKRKYGNNTLSEESMAFYLKLFGYSVSWKKPKNIV